MWAQIVNTVLGLIIMIAPDLWDYNKLAADNNHTVGPVIITFAITAIWEVNRNIRWFNVLAGFWLLFSPFFLNLGSARVTEFNMFMGILVILCSLFKGTIEQRFGGGWRSLLQKNPEHLKETQAVPE